MKDLGIEDRFIFIDKQSGYEFDRPNYNAMKNIIREGDLIYIDALDRLGRNYDGIIKEWKEVTRKLEADIVILENPTLFDSQINILDNNYFKWKNKEITGVKFMEMLGLKKNTFYNILKQYERSY